MFRRLPPAPANLFALMRVLALAATLLLCLPFVRSATAQGPATFVVNATADPGDGLCNATECTLREAIGAAAIYGQGTAIHFAIPGAGPHTIAITEGLPLLPAGITLDGYTQPNATPNSNDLADGGNASIQIVLDGGGGKEGGAPPLGLTVGQGAVVRGFAIGGFSTGVTLMGGTVQGSFVGVLPDGVTALPNGTGVYVNGIGHIGGENPQDRMVISGNGVGVLASSANGRITGSYIGVAADGRTALGNRTYGIEATFSGVWVTASVVSANNIGISSSEGSVSIVDSRIGTDAGGVDPLGNTDTGVVAYADGGSTHIYSSTIAYNGEGVRLSNQAGMLADSAVHHNKQGGLRMSHRWRGDFTVARSVLHANDGGGMHAYAMNVTIVDSEFRDNQGGEGAALYLNQFATAAITGTVFIADVFGSTGAGGGAIFNRGSLTLVNSTLAATPALGDALLVNLGRADLRSVTLAGPLANGGSVTAANTILGGCTTSPAVPIGAPPLSLGHNLDAARTCALEAEGDRSGIDPRLGLLGNNGGRTWTRALLAGSPALDAGDPALCVAAYDQRGDGYARSRDGDGDGAAICDIGAFEVQEAPPPTVTPEPATVTPEPATVTPEPPTVTPELSTVTPAPATVTPRATFTPLPPTAAPTTPVPTMTPTVQPQSQTPAVTEGPRVQFRLFIPAVWQGER